MTFLLFFGAEFQRSHFTKLSTWIFEKDLRSFRKFCRRLPLPVSTYSELLLSSNFAFFLYPFLSLSLSWSKRQRWKIDWIFFLNFWVNFRCFGNDPASSFTPTATCAQFVHTLTSLKRRSFQGGFRLCLNDLIMSWPTFFLFISHLF